MKNLFACTVLAALLAFSASSQAITFNKEVTVADGRGGQMVAVTSGDLSSAGAARSTDASFRNFQPQADGASINGALNREFRRDGRDSESVLNGSLTVTPGANAQNPQVLNIVIADLRVLREGDGPQLSGSITVNGQTVPADRLPKPLRALLRRLVGLTQL
jgi:hypothetical protein